MVVATWPIVDPGLAAAVGGLITACTALEVFTPLKATLAAIIAKLLALQM